MIFNLLLTTLNQKVMKPFTYKLLSVLFLFLFLSSCSKNDLDVIPTSKVLSTDKASALMEAGGEAIETITPTTPLPFMTKYDLSIKNASATNSKSSASGLKASATNLAIAGWTQFGPFTTTAELILYQSNVKLYIPHTPNNAAGVYFCDVYRAQKTINLQLGDLFAYESVSKSGYKDPVTQELGVNITQTVTQTINSYYVYTYSVVPKYTVSGQRVNIGTFPQDLTGTTFTYSYLRNI